MTVRELIIALLNPQVEMDAIIVIGDWKENESGVSTMQRANFVDVSKGMWCEDGQPARPQQVFIIAPKAPPRADEKETQPPAGKLN